MFYMMSCHRSRGCYQYDSVKEEIDNRVYDFINNILKFYADFTKLRLKTSTKEVQVNASSQLNRSVTFSLSTVVVIKIFSSVIPLR